MATTSRSHTPFYTSLHASPIVGEAYVTKNTSSKGSELVILRLNVLVQLFSRDEFLLQEVTDLGFFLAGPGVNLGVKLLLDIQCSRVLARYLFQVLNGLVTSRSISSVPSDNTTDGFSKILACSLYTSSKLP